jgi:hypothetical protein
MSFRRAFIGLVFALATSETAVAQQARQVEVGYEVAFAGISGFRIDVTARLGDRTYDIETSTFKNGMLKAVTMNYFGRNRAWGGFTAQGVQPTAGSLSIMVGAKPRTWLVQYGPGGTIAESHTPEWKPAPQQAIPESDRRDSLDPLSSALSVALAGDAGCDRTVRTNDGKRRIDVMLHKVRTEPAAASGIIGAQGDVLVCDIYTKRISGEFYEAPKEAEAERERPVRIWLARFDQTQIRYPGKLEAQTGLGTIRGKLLWLRERPMTQEEAQAMRR